MAPDENNPGGWSVPDGFTLTRIDGHYVDDKGFAVTGSGKPLRTTQDGTREVPEWNEKEPFVWQENDGKGANASDEARAAAEAGTPLAGWNPNVRFRPIKDSWMPPQFTLTWDDDPTPVTEPASITALPVTPEQEVATLKASIAAAQARILEIKGAGS